MNKRRNLFLVAALFGVLPLFLALDENSFSDNQARLASMSPEQMEQLLRNRDKFAMLSEEEQDKLRRFDQELHREPNAELLMQTLRGYHEWLSALRSTERAKLKDLQPTARISEITQLIAARRERDIGLTDATRLPSGDNEALRKWASDFATRKQSDIAKLFPGGERGPQPGSRRGNRPPAVAALVISVGRGFVPEAKLDELVASDDLDQLAKSLSPKANAILADQKSKLEKIKLVFRWIFASFQTRVSEENLRTFFREGLDDNQREIIYRLGPEQGRQELERLYNESRRRRMQFRSPENESGRLPNDPPRGRPDFD